MKALTYYVWGSVIAMCVFAAAEAPAAPVDDLRVSQLEQEVRELQRQVQQQARRIERLESAPPPFRSTVPAPPGHLPTAPSDENPAWKQNASWEKLKVGMSEAETAKILGPPTTVRKAEKGDAQILFYSLELEGGGFLTGRVVVSERRVIEIHKPELK